MAKFVSQLRRRQKGFTLIELLIVVAIIGIIAALLIPNLIDALHKGRQKRTMGDIRGFGTALGMHHTDNGGAAAAGQTNDISISDFSGNANNVTDIDELETALVTDGGYTTEIPARDAWGNDLEYNVSLQEPPRSNYALVRATALEGDFESDTYTVGDFEPTDFVQDIVWADGTFVRRPRGGQAQAATTTP